MRAHEWAWGDVGRRSVCGIAQRLDRHRIVSDLGAVDPAARCKNCERMRAAIGASSRPVAPEPLPVAPGSNLAEAVAEIALERKALTDRERGIIEHAVGWRSRWPLYRNHFCAGPSHDDWATIQGLIGIGLMHISREPSPLSGGDTVFAVTAIGIAALKGSGGSAARGELRASSPEKTERP